MIRRLFAICMFAVLLAGGVSSCDGETVELDFKTKEEIHDTPKAPHALLFYFVGTSLDYYFGNNVEAVMRAVTAEIPGRDRIAYFRRVEPNEPAWAICEIYYNEEEGCAETRELKRYENPDLNDIGIYLSDMIHLVPAESYGAVFGGHGSAWLPKSIGTGWTNKYSVGSSSAGMPPFGEMPREDALPTRYFGEAAVMFDVSDIAAAMEESGAWFEYVIFDDCFMSNIESLYEMRRAVDCIIASPCEVMAEGFPYAHVIPNLFTEHGRDLEGVCRAYHEYYLNEAPYRYGCVAMTVCSELEELAARYANLLSGLTNTVDPSELQYYEGFSSHLFYDFMQYAEALSANPWLLNDFKEQFDRAFPESCRLHTPDFYTVFGYRSVIPVDYYSGVTVSEPADRNVDLNRETEWYRATHRISD